MYRKQVKATLLNAVTILIDVNGVYIMSWLKKEIHSNIMFLASSADELIDPISDVFEPSNVTTVTTFQRQAPLISADIEGYILCLDIPEVEFDSRDGSRVRYSRRYILITIVQSKC